MKRFVFGGAAIAVAALTLLSACGGGAAPTATPVPAKPAATPVPTAAPTRAAPTATAAVAPTSAPAGSYPVAVDPKVKRGGTLRIGTNGKPLTFDPQRATSIRDLYATAPAYNGVLQYDPHDDMKVVADLAESWKMAGDGTSYTFSLRKGVRWHDGTPFTSADVVNFINRGAFPKEASHPDDLADVASVSATDESTVVVKLKYASPSFPNFLAGGWQEVLPKHILDKQPDVSQTVMGTGPYKFVKYVTDLEVDFIKNPDYFVKGLPYLDELKYFVILDDGQRFAALRTGQVDMLPNFPGLTAPQVKIVQQSEPKIKLTFMQSLLSPIGMRINADAGKPLSDVRLRRAISLALDRQEALQGLQGGNGMVGGDMPPWWAEWNVPESELKSAPGLRQPKDQDIAEAKNLVKQSGYSGAKLSLAVLNSAFEQTAALWIQDQAKKIGVTVDLAVYDYATRAVVGQKGDYDLYQHTIGYAVPDPLHVMRRYDPRAVPHSYVSPDLIRIMDSFTTELDRAKRVKLAQEWQQTNWRDVTFVTIVWPSAPMAAHEYLKNFQPHSSTYNNLKFMDVWLDK